MSEAGARFSAGLAELVLIVQDVPSAARFYRDVVGLVPETEPDAGLWELRGSAKVHTFSAVMCWVACDRLARIAVQIGQAQRAAYCAHLRFDDLSILSLSPELFFRWQDGALELRPMKGTRPRGRWPAEVIALHFGNAQGPHPIKLIDCLNAFGCGSYAKPRAQGRNRLHDRKTMRIDTQSVNKGFV